LPDLYIECERFRRRIGHPAKMYSYVTFEFIESISHSQY